MTAENEIVLIHFEETPLSYARIESIEPDIKRGWYHVKLLLLQIPLQVVTWILRDVYIDGETFTMNGKQMRLERIVCPEEEDDDDDDDLMEKSPPVTPPARGKVISLAELKKKE
jgi:hypothetical protein